MRKTTTIIFLYLLTTISSSFSQTSKIVISDPIKQLRSSLIVSYGYQTGKKATWFSQIFPKDSIYRVEIEPMKAENASTHTKGANIYVSTLDGKVEMYQINQWNLNLILAQLIPKEQFFSRISIKNDGQSEEHKDLGNDLERIQLITPKTESFLDVNKDEKPIYLLDDEEVSENFIKNLDSKIINTIRSIFTVKPWIAKHDYGDRGKYGVFQINTKDSGRKIFKN